MAKPRIIKIRMPVQQVYIPHQYFPGKQMLWFNSAMVGELIAAMKLVPANVTATQGMVGGEKMAAAMGAIDLNGTHGGIRAMHLHYDNKIYMLNDKQWAEISTKILVDVKAKLENVKEIGFEEGVTLGSMVAR
jgi:hypothetical protein